jgi:ATP-dependent RNA helicase DeaD
MPKDIVGAIANEAGVEYDSIGYIGLESDYSTVDLPESMPAEILQHLKKIRVRQRPMDISVESGSDARESKPNFAGKPRPYAGQDTGYEPLKRKKFPDESKPRFEGRAKPGFKAESASPDKKSDKKRKYGKSGGGKKFNKDKKPNAAAAPRKDSKHKKSRP